MMLTAIRDATEVSPSGTLWTGLDKVLLKNTALGTNLKLAEMYWMIYKVFFISIVYDL